MARFALYGLLCTSLFCMVSTSLESVHLIFRHGERCPDRHFMHPRDPYKNKSFAPYGQGQITNLGKQQGYNLGLDIRKRYNSFIGEYYNGKAVDPWSTPIPRTQTTLMLVLAGLFKPSGYEVWNKDLLWQPIPFKYISKIEEDDIFLPVLFSKQYLEEYKKAFHENGYHIINQHRNTIEYISKHVNVTIRDCRQAFILYMSISTENCVGYPLPSWFTSIAEDFERFAACEYQMQIRTVTLQKLAMGKLLKMIVDDTNAKIKNTTEIKLHLYSAHDVNIAHILMVLGRVDVNKIIPYAACVAIEVHKSKENAYNVHVVYKNGSDGDWKTITAIPLNSLERLVGDFFETDAMAGSSSKYAEFSYIVLPILFIYILCK